MSSERDRCGEHCLDCKCKIEVPFLRPHQIRPRPQDKFFYKGKFFQIEESFWKFIEDWPFMETDTETFEREWERLGKDIWMNVQMRQIAITNGAMNEILEEILFLALSKFFKKQN